MTQAYNKNRLWVDLAIAYAGQQRFESAMTAYQQASPSSNLEDDKRFVIELVNQSQMNRAVDVVKELGPSQPKYVVCHAMIDLIKKNRWNDVRKLREATREIVNIDTSFYGLSELIYQSKLDEALNILRKLQGIWPDATIVNMHLAKLQAKVGGRRIPRIPAKCR